MIFPLPDAPTGFQPFADRNKQPILDVLSRVLLEHGSALEIASGSPWVARSGRLVQH